MWSGSGMCGNSTTSGRGKSGIVEGMDVTSRAQRGPPRGSAPEKLPAYDLDGQIAVAGPVELRRDDRLELTEDQLAPADREREGMAEQRRLQVRVRVVAVAVGGVGVVVAPLVARAHDLLQHRLHVVQERGLPLVDEQGQRGVERGEEHHPFLDVVALED